MSPIPSSGDIGRSSGNGSLERERSEATKEEKPEDQSQRESRRNEEKAETASGGRERRGSAGSWIQKSLGLNLDLSSFYRQFPSIHWRWFKHRFKPDIAGDQGT